MTAVIDPFVLKYAPGPLVQMDPALVRARAAFNALLDSLAAIPDERLTSLWKWHGRDADVRYGFYRVFELLESLTSEASRAVAGEPSSEARDAVAAATASRWALQGILATLSDADLDADPGGGEWSVRRTLQHIVNSQRGYAWGSANWLSRRGQPRPEPARLQMPESEHFPEEEDEALGSLADVRPELNDIVDTTSSRYATLNDEDMLVDAGWSGIPVTIGFRQWRWSSHIAEHSVQIEKTLDRLGKRRGEVDWLTRLVAGAYGRLEAVVFGRASAGAAAAVFDRAASELEKLQAIKPAADAGVPAPDW